MSVTYLYNFMQLERRRKTELGGIKCNYLGIWSAFSFYTLYQGAFKIPLVTSVSLSFNL